MASKIGKRYQCEQCGNQVLVVKPGQGSLKCCGQEMQQKMEYRERLKEIDHPTLGHIQVLNTPLRYTNSKACVEGLPPTVPVKQTNYVLSEILRLSPEEIKDLRAKKIVFTEESQCPR